MVWGRILDRQEIVRLLAVIASEKKADVGRDYQPPSARLLDALDEEPEPEMDRAAQVAMFVARTR